MTKTETARQITTESPQNARLVVYPPTGLARAVILGRSLDLGRDPTNGLKLDDRRVSGAHARLRKRRDSGRWEVVDEGSTNGTFVDGQRVAQSVLDDQAVLRFGDTLAVFELGVFAADTAPDRSFAAAVLDREVAWAASLPSPVLFLGPTGAGKNHLARQLAEASPHGEPYVHVNCAALPENLVESELFGHVRGAFTGASTDKRGLLDEADGGTLFLDEIGAVAPEVQAKLLTCIESGELRPVGATRPHRVRVRCLGATNLDVEEAIAAGRFREDLYFRLAAVTVTVPPLAGRRADVVPIFTRALRADHRALTAEAVEALLCWSWPGNVRELLNLAERLAAAPRPLDYHLLPGPMTGFLRDRSVDDAGSRSRTAPPREVLVAELEAVGGNVSELARRLGKHRNQVVRWLDAYGLRDGRR